MFDPKKKHTERELMDLAVMVAERSVFENDGRPHPMVGAVIARDGYVLQTGFRGEKAPGAHAEETALEKLSAAQAVGTTVYSTLEPCTIRGQMCAQRLITKQVSRVCIGMLDPNPDIRGQGEWLLESVGISIGKFESDLVAKIKAQNSEFIDYMRGLGVTISSPANGATIGDEPISVRGNYRTHPRAGDNVVIFARRDFTYFPQIPISWSRNREERTWECQRVWLTALDKPKEYGIVVARVSEDFSVCLRSYTKVHNFTGRWIGAEMPNLPPGFEVLASITVTRSAKKP
jgi:pyrimidine deaminase RibD-like protein